MTDHTSPQDIEIEIPVDASVTLSGFLGAPTRSRRLVVFVHGSGSSRFSPRNRQVAGTLQQRGLATLLMDLLTPDEEAVDELTRQYRFDIARLARRVVATVRWLDTQPAWQQASIGLFGASTGAAAALIAAADCPDRVKAVVSRGGRPDLAGDSLESVRCPTLLIVGGYDREVLSLNRGAMARIPAETRLHVVPRATHLFEEPGALDEVASQTAAWFERHL